MQPQATTITISLPNLLSKKQPRATGLRQVFSPWSRPAADSSCIAPLAAPGRPPQTRERSDTNGRVGIAGDPARSGTRPATRRSTGSGRAWPRCWERRSDSRPHLNTVPAGRVSQILTDLRIAPDSTLDPAALRRLAELSGADTVMWGQYVKFGNEIRIDATLQDVKHQRTIPLKDAGTQRDRAAWRDRTARGVGPGEPGVVAGGDQGVGGDVVQALVQVGAGAPVSTTKGSELSRQGTAPRKRRSGSRPPTQEDTKFALAYSKLADSHATVGHDTTPKDLAQRGDRRRLAAAA